MADCSVSWVGAAQFCQAACMLHPLTVPAAYLFLIQYQQGPGGQSVFDGLEAQNALGIFPPS